MSNFNNIAEVEAVFKALQLSPIEKGMKEIQDAKQNFTFPSGVPSTGANLRVVLTNGTGALINKDKDTLSHAELERRLSRTSGV